jgi:diguanylate cyclase (GGDEF)-like protein
MDQAPSRPHARAADDFLELLQPGAIRAVFQPIVRLGDLQPVGYEGLARFPTPPGLVALPPDVTLAAAGRMGVRYDLEVACWAAISEAGAPPAGRLMFVNVAPDALGHPGLLALADSLPSRLVIELTEQDAVQDVTLLRERLRPWISRGALVAVDDAGAGFTSLEYVAEIRPDFLKLCRGMVTGVDHDPSRMAVLRATVAFAHEVGARIVAEGVERPEELAVLRDAEVDYGQGWLFGRPTEAWPEEPAARPAPVRRAPGGRLERELAAATSAREASEAVAVHLSRRGLMPSVYLEDGGRLRCQAVRGYWQVFDGISPSAGVIGRAFRTGRPVLVDDVDAEPDYLEAVSVVHAELAVPIRVGGRVVGVLNTETPTSIDLDAAAEVERCAALLGTRLDDLGGCGGVSPAQQLARVAVRLNALDDPEDIVRETLAAARQLAGFESAMLALSDGHGGLYSHHSEGSFAVAFAQLDCSELAHIAGWVSTGSSSYTVADTGGRGFTGHEVLREAGVNALGVFPLAAGADRLGVLVVADRGNHRLSTEEAELLELLATQAAGSLRMAAAVHELRERAERDPLTGLGHHATFHAELPAARAATPADRRTALLLADVDGFKAINDAHGHAAGDDVLRAVAHVLRNLATPDGRAFRIGGDEFAMLFECGSEADAQRVGWALQSRSRGGLGTTLSIGLAIAEPSEDHEDLVARADAAMYEVKRRGRDGVLVAKPASTDSRGASPPWPVASADRPRPE